MENKAIITITDNGSTLDINLNFEPMLDTKNPDSNHAAIAALKMVHLYNSMMSDEDNEEEND